jgi:hypothetical protein
MSGDLPVFDVEVGSQNNQTAVLLVNPVAPHPH